LEGCGEPLVLRPVVEGLVWIRAKVAARTGRVSREEGLISDWTVEELLVWDVRVSVLWEVPKEVVKEVGDV
jgi:hypothetical protein